MSVAGVPERVHLVGIGGAHMSAIARILHAWGHTVSGCDQALGAATGRLIALGIDVREGHDSAHLEHADMVVHTSATREDNADVVTARALGLPVLKRDEMVARLMEGRYSIAVAGTHGKTTTSGLIAHMLVEAKLEPTYLIGGEVRSLGTNAAAGSGRYIVVEADEYDRAFLSYRPDVAVILNVEPDHLDIYGDVEELTRAFSQFASSVPIEGHLISCADSPRGCEAAGAASVRAHDRQTYALDAAADWSAEPVSHDDRSQTFMVDVGGRPFGAFTIGLPGRHNVSNALAGIATGSTLGLETAVMQAALASYRGAQRRFEYVAEAAGVTMMDDYAHHPTEVRTTVQAARERFGERRLVMVFQPHTFSRTQYLLDEWRGCFAGVDRLYITHTYAAREEASLGLSGEDLARSITAPRAEYAGPFEEAARRIASELRANDVFFTVGAGDVNAIGPMVLDLLRQGQP